MPSAPFVLHRDILYRRIWAKPAKAVARDLGISIASLIRICEKLAIPHPTTGYWARHEAGLEEPTPLPPVGDGPTKHEFDLDKSVRFHRPSQEARRLIRAEYRRNTQVRASDDAPSHPLVVAAAPRLGENDYVWKPPFGCLEVVTGPECRERALRLMDSLLRALDRRKFRVEVKVARRYAISDVALKKICRKLNVPVPWRGYWAQKAAGQKLKQPKLPAAKEGQPTTHRISSRTILNEPRVPRPELSEQAQQLIERERLPEYHIRVADELVDPHPFVAASAPGLRKPEKRAPRRVPEKTLLIHVGPEAVERALRIMDALLKALELRGFKPEIFPFPPPGEPLRGPAGTGAWVLGQFVEIRLDENQEWFDPRKEPGYTEKTAGKDSLVRITLPRSAFYRSTGKLSLGLNYLPKHGERRTWSDGRSQKLEDCLNEFVKGVIITADRMRQEHEAEERERRLQAEAARARIEQQRRKELDGRLRSGFRKRLDTWFLAKSARDFIQAVEDHRRAELKSTEFQDWITWAKQYASMLEAATFDVMADLRPPPPRPESMWPVPRQGRPRPSY